MKNRDVHWGMIVIGMVFGFIPDWLVPFHFG